MKNFLNHTKLFSGLAGVGVAISVVFTGGYGIADTYRSDLDSRLKTQSYKPVGGDATARYKSSYDSAKSFIKSMEGIGERVEAEGAVLLKNKDSALPLKKEGNNVTLFGVHSKRLRYGASVNCESPAMQNVPVDQAFKNNGFNVNPDIVSFYGSLTSKYKKGSASGSYNGATVNEIPQTEYAQAPSSYASYNDAAIVFLGRDSGEGLDYYPGEKGIANPEEFNESKTGNIFSLSDDERDLIRYVKSKNFKKIVVVINSCSTMELDELDDEKSELAVDSILWIGNPGPYGINAIPKILNGTISPSGHLADTYAVNTANSPAAKNYGVYTYSNYKEIDPSAAQGTYSLQNSWYIAQLEGIYTGYK